jgi:hypothetical protein
LQFKINIRKRKQFKIKDVIRDNNWKKKATCIKLRNKNKTQKHQTHDTLTEIKVESLEEAQRKKIEERRHKQKLDNILHSNDLTRVPVMADGDCLLKSVLINSGEKLTLDELRTLVCDHLITYKENYMYVVSDTGGEDVRNQIFENMVDDLRKPGHWNNVVGDCVPLAICNILRKNIRIFSSNSSKAVHDISPDINEVTSDEHICVAYVDIEQHYDSVISVHSEQIACKIKQSSQPNDR